MSARLEQWLLCLYLRVSLVQETSGDLNSWKYQTIILIPQVYHNIFCSCMPFSTTVVVISCRTMWSLLLIKLYIWNITNPKIDNYKSLFNYDIFVRPSSITKLAIFAQSRYITFKIRVQFLIWKSENENE